MLKEERNRDKEKIDSATELASSSQAKLASERDAAIHESCELQQQLTTTLADLDIANADKERVLRSNANLQSALESFQSERDAESALLEEQRQQSEVANAAAHAASIDAMHEANEARMREVQMAADAAVRNILEEIRHTESTLEVKDDEAGSPKLFAV